MKNTDDFARSLWETNLILIAIWFAVAIGCVALGDDRPPEPWLDLPRIEKIESKLADHESRLDALEGKTSAKCPCPDGECICPADACDCPDCPVHTKSASVEYLGFSASWCVHCPGAKADSEGLPIRWLDLDSPEARKYHVSEVPAVVRIVNGQKEGHFVGRTGLANRVRTWVAGAGVEMRNRGPVPAARSYDDGDASDEQIRQHLVDAHGYSWGQVNGMSRSQLKAAHDNAHGGPSLVSKNYPVPRSQPIRYVQPAYYQPRVYYQPSYGSCPNCAR